METVSRLEQLPEMTERESMIAVRHDDNYEFVVRNLQNSLLRCGTRPNEWGA